MKTLLVEYGKILQKEFSLAKPVFIVSQKNLIWKKTNEACFAIYWGRKHSHKITIHSDVFKCPVMLFATMAHEYIHAWQEENGYSKMRHNNDQFPEWAKYFKKAHFVDVIKMSTK